MQQSLACAQRSHRNRRRLFGAFLKSPGASQGWWIIVCLTLGCGSDDSEQPAPAPAAGGGAAQVAAQPDPVGHFPEIWPQDLWQQNELPVLEAPYSATPQAKDLKQGGLTTIGGLNARTLAFSLPPREQRAWSADGKTLYAWQGSQLVRIAVPQWELTHVLDLSELWGYQLTSNGVSLWSLAGRQFEVPRTRAVTLCSEGIVVAVRLVVEEGGKTPFGEEIITYERRTGKVITEEVSVRQLFLLDPLTLAVKRQYYGPAAAVAGSPASPLVCVTDDGEGLGLLDMRSGKMIDSTWGSPATATSLEGNVFETLTMSPDGKTLYAGGEGGVFRADLASGTLKSLPPLALSSAPVRSSPLARLPAYARAMTGQGAPDYCLSADGGQLAVFSRGSTGRHTYTILSPRDRDVLDGTLSFTTYDIATDCDFVGKTARFAYSSGTPVDAFLNLELPALDGSEGTRIRLPISDLGPDWMGMRMCGWPAGEHLLISKDSGTTLLLQLPPPQGMRLDPSQLHVEPRPVKGEVPSDPIVFAASEEDDEYDFPGVRVDRASSIACSFDGKRLYVVESGGWLHSFDSESLHELRRVQTGLGDAWPLVAMTKLGPVVSVADAPTYDLYDAETLDGLVRIVTNVGDRDVAFAAGSHAMTLATESGDLKAYDVRSGRLIDRVAARTFEEIEPPDAAASNLHGKAVHAIAMSPDGATVMCRHGAWHVFELSENGLKHLRQYTPLPDGHQFERNLAIPLTPAGLIYSGKADPPHLELVGLRSLQTLEEVECQVGVRLHEFKAMSSEGLLYVRENPSGEPYRPHPFNKTLDVYRADGTLVYSGEAFLWGSEPDRVIPVPGRPTRVFIQAEDYAYVVDLQPVEPES